MGSEDYKRVYLPTHPNATQCGIIAEHRLLAEKIVGRHLKPEEHVHHINENKADNRLENLMVFASNTDHVRYHAFLKTKTGLPSKLVQHLDGVYSCGFTDLYEKVCVTCGKTFMPLDSRVENCSEKCGEISTRVVKERPSKEQLIKEIKESSYVAVGKKYGVSDNAIRKWVKAYGLNPKEVK